MKRYLVRLDLSKQILTPHQWPAYLFGKYNQGNIVHADSESVAIREVAGATGVSQSMLIATEKD